MNLDKLFNPQSIAVIGASNKKGSVGYALFKNIKKSNYKGRLYPINHKRKSIQGLKAYRSVANPEVDAEMAIIATPAFTVPSIVKECAVAKIKNIVVISAGFLEAGVEGKKLFEGLIALSKKHKINILGPNCLGFLNPRISLNASFASQNARSGGIAFISQSGALCTSMLDWANQNNIGFSYFISIGSMADIGFGELLDFLGKDKNTNSILCYIESIKDPKNFINIARKVVNTKPIFALKVGRTSAGAKAAQSHTGSLAGNDLAYELAFKKTGIVRINSVEELFNSAKILSMQSYPKGKRLAVITNAGGPGVLTADACAKEGLELAKIDKLTMSKLNKILPKAWSRNNPIDILGDADPERYLKTLKICSSSKNIDGLLVILTPQAMTNPTAVARELVKIKTKKTVLACFMGGNDLKKGFEVLEQSKIPTFLCPENAVKAFKNLSGYQSDIHNKANKAVTYTSKRTEKNKVEKTLNQARKDNIGILPENKAKKVLAAYGLKSLPQHIIRNKKEIDEIFNKSNGPFVFKAVAANLLHKTDLGGVKLDIDSIAYAKKAYKEITSSFNKNKKIKFQGVLVERQLDARIELFIGLKRDPKFGPIILFGRGGTEVELYNDVSAKLAPISIPQAIKMINATKVGKLLNGYRGQAKYDIKKLAMLLYDFSRLVCDFPEIVELDINPIVPDAKDYKVLDAKVVLG